MIRKVFGWGSAVAFAKGLEYGKNMTVSAQLIVDANAEIERLKRALCVAAGLLSTTEEWEHKHPDECHAMLVMASAVSAALKRLRPGPVQARWSGPG